MSHVSDTPVRSDAAQSGRARRSAGRSAGHVARHGVNFFGVLKSEWIKFWSLRSTRILLVVTLVSMIGVGTLVAYMRSLIYEPIVSGFRDAGAPVTISEIDESLPPELSFYTLPASGLQLGAIIIGALAVLFMASEYATGMIRSSFAATPKRLPVFAAKAIVIIVGAYVIGLIATLMTFFLANVVISGLGVSLSFDTLGVLPGILLGGFYVAGVALAGLALATLMRNSAGAIMVLLGAFFILGFTGGLLAQIPGDFWKNVPQYLPSQAAGRMIEIGQVPGYLDPLPAALVFLGWILLVLVPALIFMKRRDA
ncbi:ABC transporter permease subunit [Acaricomes phytoseiuli]|uniref:ABC transporter permease subunit n=1 Tax=Acaricomes phytoseiuli TaxID=291968 RepID=UPI001FDF2E7A|nr:ABC transporter permease subunit [Acaricomes phytoseiuli]